MQSSPGFSSFGALGAPALEGSLGQAAGVGDFSSSSLGAASVDGSDDVSVGGQRSSSTAFEQSRVAEFIRIQMNKIFLRSKDQKALNLTENFKNQNFISFGEIPDTTEGLFYFNQMTVGILNGTANDENEATLLDLRNQLNLIQEGVPGAEKNNGLIDVVDLGPQELSILDRAVEKLDDLIDREQERKQRLAEAAEDRRQGQAKNAGGGDGGGGSGGGGSGGGGSSPPSLPGAQPGSPPKPIEQPKHSPDPAFMEGINKFFEENARMMGETPSMVPKDRNLGDITGELLGTIPAPETKADTPVDTAGILGLQRRELGNLTQAGVPAMPSFFPQQPAGNGFLANIQAFAQGGNGSRLMGGAITSNRPAPPGRFPSSPVGISTALALNRLGRTSPGIRKYEPRLTTVPNFAEFFSNARAASANHTEGLRPPLPERSLFRQPASNASTPGRALTSPLINKPRPRGREPLPSTH